MFGKKNGLKSRWQRNQWAMFALVSFFALLLIPLPGNTKEKKGNNSKLPPTPDTGSPEEDFSAGGTRDNRHRDTVCGIDREQIAYLLGNKNREYTLSAHPTFWFHIPNTINKVAQMKFVVTELETGKKIYDRVVERTKKSSIIGIELPKEKQYALSLEVNYAWSLKINCAGASQDSEIALEGWLTRLPSRPKLQKQLTAAPEAEKYAVYLRHDFLYDAVTQLARRYITKPNNAQVKTAWNQLLTQLGWPDLIQQESATHPSILDTRISSQKN